MFKFSTITIGNPCCPPVIFLHGFLGSKTDWEEIIPFFEKSYYCLVIDLPGHGESPYTEKIISEVQLVASKFEKKPILIGYSMGGRIALQLRKIAAAVIALSAHIGLASITEREARRNIDKIWSNKLLNQPFDAFLKEWYSQPIFHSFPSSICIKRRQKQNPIALSHVMEQLSLANQPHITDFPCPTLFMYGEKDLKYRDLYSTLSPQVDVRCIEACGHAIILENAPSCAIQILKWIEGLNANG